MQLFPASFLLSPSSCLQFLPCALFPSSPILPSSCSICPQPYSLFLMLFLGLQPRPSHHLTNPFQNVEINAQISISLVSRASLKTENLQLGSC